MKKYFLNRVIIRAVATGAKNEKCKKKKKLKIKKAIPTPHGD